MKAFMSTALTFALCVGGASPRGFPSVRAENPSGHEPSALSPLVATPVQPPATYWVYVVAESADRMHRVRFGPDGLVVEKTVMVGEAPVLTEGPHGITISPDGRFLYLTMESSAGGQGLPQGTYWKYELGPDTVVGDAIHLGNFPATIDITPDGLYTFSVNFNLHGDMVPSSVSVVFTPSVEEVARIVTCTMPHGGRIDPSGNFFYSGCMMDDQLVEIDTRTFRVSRRFSVAKGQERPLPAEDPMVSTMIDQLSGGRARRVDPAVSAHTGDGTHRHEMTPPTCSPTWAQPSLDGAVVWVACNRSDEILEIDRQTWSLRRKFSAGRGPYNLAQTPDGRYLLATLKQGASFEILDVRTGESVARLRNSTTVAHGVVATPDSKYAFVVSEAVGAEPGKIDVYDLTARTKVATADLGLQAGGIAFWKMERQ
jgi:DNA-binding beta-propeller fold protein YncE